ncbi:hypothetical protein [Poseidonocella sedimentorum]|uniref:Sulfotransferase family protein n=1 Tax=Poseidonocella sedimentorum TaxID=871652 RepID=A0A1I6CUP0_9RHOB|nr:hypothetical protein [Poseidonocella sedimentorum]SFQ96919.1 hypothetical protein SAMN04515673_101403 [Poseidonocella sedimentorum]
MKIVTHIGAHETDRGRLLNCLLRNAGMLRERGVEVPRPSVYRRYLLGVLSAMTEAPEADAHLRREMQDLFLPEGGCARLILANSSFACRPKDIFRGGRLYGAAAARMRNFARVFPDCAFEIHLGVSSMAHFIPALVTTYPHFGYGEFLNGADPARLSWVPLLRDLRAALPEAGLTVWCDEETPLIWSDLMHAITGLGPDVPMEGELEMLQELLPEEVLARLVRFLAAHPPKDPARRHRIIEAYLSRAALDEKLELEVELPGWDDRLIDVLHGAYARDLDTIAVMPGVRFISA